MQVLVKQLWHGLAQRIANGNVPDEMAKMRVLELDLMNVVAGTRFRGTLRRTYEQYHQKISKGEDGKVILFIDELHTIMGSGSGIDSTLDAANIQNLPSAWNSENCWGNHSGRIPRNTSKKTQPFLVALQKY